MNYARSSKRSASAVHGYLLIDHFDWIIVAAILILTFVAATSAGLRRGVELMPWPDGLEYAAAGVNLANGRGAVLHFGGYTYPSRYTAGYPLILAFFHRFYGGEFRPLNASLILGMLSVFGIFMLTRGQFWRLAATVAALLLALSPVFITYSSLAMSDVPTLFVTICAAVMLAFATSDYMNQSSSWIRMSAWLVFGLLAGFSTIIRPTNATILVGLALCVVMVPLEKGELSSLIKAGIAVAIGFAIPVGWQMHQNAINLGSPFASGYSWWVPEVYGAGGKTFSIAYLFGPTMPRNPHGNVIVYLSTLLGLDGMLGDRGDARYFLYPFAAAVFAIVGFIAIFRTPGRFAARRLMWFGLGYLAALTVLYSFYLFTDVAFILPGAFVLFMAAGAGAAASNRYVPNVIRNPNRSVTKIAAAASVIVLDILLVVSLATEAAVRLSAQPASSAMVESLASLDSSVPRDATVISNISLQFLDLYLGEDRRYVGLNSLDPGERFTDYHLHRLYEKRATGWTGPVPQVVFDGGQMDKKAADAIASAVAGKTPVYLIVAAPESQQYADVLKGELDALQRRFAIEPVSQNEAVAVYRLTASQVGIGDLYHLLWSCDESTTTGSFVPSNFVF
jgi:4-amino-4-deoxy-L-arabinose transferase-like glycosyltransferase